MLKFIKKTTVLVAATMLAGASFGQANADCNTLEPICSDAGVQFSALSNVAAASVTNPGNNYNCLSSSPNPTWYFMQVSVAGQLDFSLSAPQDIDFIIYGPFANLPDAQAGCENYGNGGTGANVVDCSYSSTNNETPSIPNAQVGEVYVLLITNYANSPQNVDFSQTNAGGAGAGDLDCNIVTNPPCVSDPGTFIIQKNGVISTSPVYLCENETFDIISNGDYTLPNDTIAQPVGDGIYSAQLLWLVYNAAPTSADPAADPAFLNFAIPSDDINDANSGVSPVVAAFGCGTYFFVPVAGDDGVGGNNNTANGTDDNGQLHWDKNGNGCYNLGTPIEVTYACPITATASVNCNPPTVINGIDIDIAGGQGAYTIVNQGAGNLASTNVPNGGTATVADLDNNNIWNIDITDTQGCTANINGVFSAPVITDVTITPAPDCPLGGTGNVAVTVSGTSGQGAPYTIVMAGDPPTAGTTDNYTDNAGVVVPIVVADQAGCISDSTVTITSAGHYIDVQITNIQGEFCFGDGTGTATISATPMPSGNVTTIVWTDPLGGTFPGTATNVTQNNMIPGIWTVCVTDDFGCEYCIPVEITAPQELDVFIDNSNEPVCYGLGDGSIDVGVTGGTAPVTYSWSHNTGLNSDVANLLFTGTYTAYVTDNNGCTDSVQMFLGEPDSLWAQFTVKDIDCYGDATGGIITDVVYGAQGNVFYNWNLGGVVPNPADTINSASNLPAGTYIMTLVDDNGCSNVYEWTLTQNPPIVLDIGTDPAQCREFGYQTTDGVVFVSASGGVSDYDYVWTEVASGATSVNTTWGGRDPGLYSVTVTDDVGCLHTETVTLDSISPIASFTVLSAELDANCEGTAPVNVKFTNTSTDFTKVTSTDDTTFFWHLNWVDPNGGAPGYYTDNWYEELDTTYTGETIYEVCLVAINANNCKDTACKEIIVHEQPVFVPANVFTPGNSGVNDVFQFFEKSQAIETFHAVIVDRWGKTVAEFNDITDTWNGNNQGGNPCNDGVYFYTYEIVYTNATTGSGQGTVTLIREP